VLDDGTKKYTPGVSSRQGSTSTFQHSGLKNATEQSNSSQTETASRQYDAFGNTVSSSGTWQGPFGYAGSFGYQEDPNGLKLLGHRYYDSATGRFITSDPIGAGSNWYAYAGNDPVSGTDPAGLLRMGANPGWLGLDGEIQIWWWQKVSDYMAGWGDSLTEGMGRGGSATDIGMHYAMKFGGVDSGIPSLTESVRNGIGYDDAVDKRSGAYENGQATGDYHKEAIATAGAGEALSASVVVSEYANAGGGGANLIVKGKRVLALDAHKWKDMPWWKWLHYHRGKGKAIKKHRPWEGW
jgi:RHS repeat-associated protein